MKDKQRSCGCVVRSFRTSDVRHDRAWICLLSRDGIAGEAFAPRPSQLCGQSVVLFLILILIMILIVLFFFLTLFALLLFGFPSLFAHCSSCSFLSASFPSTRLNATGTAHARPAPLFTHLLGFLLICPFGLLLPHACICLFARFWLHSPSPPSFPFHYQHHRTILLVFRETRFTPGLPLASNSGTHIHPLRRWRTSCLSSHLIAGLVLLSRRHHRCRRPLPEVDWLVSSSLGP